MGGWPKILFRKWLNIYSCFKIFHATTPLNGSDQPNSGIKTNKKTFSIKQLNLLFLDSGFSGVQNKTDKIIFLCYIYPFI